MRKLRSLMLVSAVGIVSWTILGSAIPATADADDAAIDLANATVSIADYNADAVSAEATASYSDNVSCTMGAFAGANVKRVQVPNTVTVHGRDVAAGNGVCSDLDAVAPDSYTAYLRITFEYLQPGTQNTWIAFDSDRCQKPSAQGSALFTDCENIHEYPDPSAPIQTYVRRTVFTIGLLVNGVEDPRSTRSFGPIAPNCTRMSAILEAFCGIAN